MESPELINALKVYNKTLEAAENAEDNVQKALGQLKKFANKSTFCVEGNYYQIRDRKGKFYLCELDGPPKGRPKKNKAKAETKPAEPKPVEAAPAPVTEPEPEPEVIIEAEFVETQDVMIVEPEPEPAKAEQTVVKESTETAAM